MIPWMNFAFLLPAAVVKRGNTDAQENRAPSDRICKIGEREVRDGFMASVTAAAAMFVAIGYEHAWAKSRNDTGVTR